MKSNILTIMKKELARFFGDKRLVLTTLVIPGLMIYLIYSLMGSGMMSAFAPSEDQIYNVLVTSPSEEFVAAADQLKLEITEADIGDIDSIKQKLRNGEIDLYVVFPEDFDQSIASIRVGEAPDEPLELEMYYSSTEVNSSAAADIVFSYLDGLEESLSNLFNINSGSAQYDVATDEDATGMLFSMLIPMLLIMFLFSGCMAVAPESIAGEKERGTIAALLVTPLKRGDLAIGKILALSIIALLSGASSFVGTLLSLPKLMGGDMVELAGIDAGVYGVTEYLTLLVVMLTTVLVIVAIISIISAYSNSVKEATTYITPLMIVVMLVGLTSMFGNGAPTNPVLYLIPIYNSVQCMNGVFSFSGSLINTVITSVANIAYTAILVVVLKKMFDSEKIMFSK
ncbi:MAG: ABC transporter permease [Clostridia bacterium]|nr:ABC transporter permease [Clostridia bacterium]